MNFDITSHRTLWTAVANALELGMRNKTFPTLRDAEVTVQQIKKEQFDLDSQGLELKTGKQPPLFYCHACQYAWDMSRAAGNIKKSERCGYCPLSWSNDNSKKCFDTGALFSDLLLAVQAGEVEQAISIANNISAVSVIPGTESDVEPHWTDD